MGCNQSKGVGVVAIPQPKKDDELDNSLTVIVVHYNPCQYERRAFLINDCLSRLCDTRTEQSQKPKAPQLHIVAVELTYDDRAPEVVPRDEMEIIRRRVSSRNIMWSKEQLINMAIERLPKNRRFISWMDSDIAIMEDNWVEATVQKLSQHPKAFAQLFATCDMLGPDGKAQVRVTSFAQQYTSGKKYQDVSNKHSDYWHPGFVWAATREALRCTNGLIAKTLGSADRHMAMAFLLRATETVPAGLHPSYLKQVDEWEQRVQVNNLELVVVPLKIVHFWHGSLKRRQYMERWEILKNSGFDLEHHLEYDEDQDLYVWSDGCPAPLVNLVSQYFEQRLEDSNVVDANENGGDAVVDTILDSQQAGEDSQEIETVLENFASDLQSAMHSATSYITQFLPGASTGDADAPASTSAGHSDKNCGISNTSDGASPSGCNGPYTGYVSAFAGYA